MPPTDEWERFVAEYASDGIYWYFPKGGTADTNEFREKFRVFQSLECEDWTAAVQSNTEASSLAGEFTRVEIGHVVMGQKGRCSAHSNGRVSLLPDVGGSIENAFAKLKAAQGRRAQRRDHVASDRGSSSTRSNAPTTSPPQTTIRINLKMLWLAAAQRPSPVLLFAGSKSFLSGKRSGSLLCLQKNWSEWQDLNLRPPRPERGALPDCATLRWLALGGGCIDGRTRRRKEDGLDAKGPGSSCQSRQARAILLETAPPPALLLAGAGEGAFRSRAKRGPGQQAKA